MNQLTFSDMEYSNCKKKTRCEEFLDTMEEIIPWQYWVDMIHPCYFNNQRGRKLVGIETMRISMNSKYRMQLPGLSSDIGLRQTSLSRKFLPMSTIVSTKQDL